MSSNDLMTLKASLFYFKGEFIMLKINKSSEYRGEIYANDSLAMYANASVSNGRIQYMNQNIQDWNVYMSHNTEIMQDFINFQNQVMTDAQNDAKATGEAEQA